MNKKAYISPLMEVIEVSLPRTLLAHFSADADFVDIGEMDPEEVEPNAPY